MGSLTRSNNADRLRAILGNTDALRSIDQTRLEDLIRAYEDGDCVYNEDGDEISTLELAQQVLTVEEKQAINEFCESIVNGTYDDSIAAVEAAESICAVPHAYDWNAMPNERLCHLLNDIVGSLINQE
jgi:transcriptional regulator with PAS, ATPase and Fis domain